ncbi:MAG TPA: acyl-CoA dehydrogenase family protein [Bacteroidia bacterium]|jgi:acyl-CoA dehydrogenase|nr:acyl-CoA dehydrogenase family protein [Bacteroidia bacterium]
MSSPLNRVVTENYRASTNFYHSDRILKNYLQQHLSKEGREYMIPLLEKQGAVSAGPMNEWSMLADKNGPVLVKRNPFGETINDIKFHPAYAELMKVAVASEMMRVKWEPGLRKRFNTERHTLGFSTGFLYAMSESGQYCPLCMTDGVARLIDLYGDEADKARLLPGIYTSDADKFLTGAMFLTEKSGGSDVGANLVQAKQVSGSDYRLSGEKWFCSNANADLIFVLARTDSSISGTKGLSIFLVEKTLPDGSWNPIDIIRLKDKLGVRSMASAECMLQETKGKLTGKEFEGFKIMAEMMNLSRLYNAVAAVSAGRRAMAEAYQFLCHRPGFGKMAVEHALIRIKLEELGALYNGMFYMLWRAIAALDKADTGNEQEAALFRLLTPMIKKWTSEAGVYLVRECMELMGGIGYIEDLVMPKIMRDVMVLPIWEGSGNIMILDMLRALHKSDGFKVMCAEIKKAATDNAEYGTSMLAELDALLLTQQALAKSEKDTIEASAALFFERLLHLYRDAVLIQSLNKESGAWIKPALHYNRIRKTEKEIISPLRVNEIHALIGWEA